MLHITVPAKELFNEKTGEFITTNKTELTLEHSLLSVSKWESKWHKAFLAQNEKTDEELNDYIKCMTLTQNVDPKIYGYLSNENIVAINKYIEDSMTATTFTEQNNKRPNREIITSEIIYYWMIAMNIPFECEKWHLNRLLTLIRVCNIKNGPEKKMSQAEIMRRNSSLNAMRKAKLNTKG